MVDDERHDPGRSILGWICDHAEAAHHLSAYDIIVGSTWRVGSLPGEDLVIVAVVRDRLTTSALISRGLGLNDTRPKGAWLFIGFGLPVQAIMLSLGANELLRILQQRIFLRIALVVFALRVNVGKAYLDYVQLIASDAPVENFLFALFRVEASARAAFNEGDRQWPFVFADL